MKEWVVNEEMSERAAWEPQEGAAASRTPPSSLRVYL